MRDAVQIVRARSKRYTDFWFSAPVLRLAPFISVDVLLLAASKLSAGNYAAETLKAL
jgi:hypothetical protein